MLNSVVTSELWWFPNQKTICLNLMNIGPPNSGFNRHVKHVWLPLILFSILDPAESQALANCFVQS